MCETGSFRFRRHLGMGTFWLQARLEQLYLEEMESGLAEEDKAAAAVAARIQAAVRLYDLRRRTPLIHLHKIIKVDDEFRTLLKKLGDLGRNFEPKRDYLRETTEILNSLLFELHALDVEAPPGVHPVVRAFQQTVINELVEFKEMIHPSVTSNAFESGLESGNELNPNSIPHMGYVYCGSPERIQSVVTGLILSEQSYEGEHFEHANGQGRALEAPVFEEGELMASASRCSYGDRKGKSLDTPVIGAGDDISPSEVLEHSVLSGSSSGSSQLSYAKILAPSREGVLDSDSERGLLIAVLLIQSSFRGFKVRRLHPLKHLRELADVRAGLKELTDLLSSPKFRVKLRSDKMERLKVTDRITALFLQLESVPGVDEVVLAIRQRLSTEVAGLQQLVDTLTIAGEENFGVGGDTALLN